MKQYDYLIVGAGLSGAVFAALAAKDHKKCLVIDRRDTIAGNLYCEKIENVNVHRYGAHIFHTDDQEVWDFVNRYAEFNRYINSPIANYKGELYNLPFNMNTFYQMWGVVTPAEARAKIARQAAAESLAGEPKNLEEKALSMVGRDVYEKLVKGYTEKQWGRSATELPPFIIGRLPARFTYDNNYFNDRYQGIPIGGYNGIIEKLLQNADVRLCEDYFDNRAYYDGIAEKTVFSGGIDEYYDCRYGHLEYRSLRFETEVLPTDNHQGVAVMNYTDRETPYTRIIEHKHFEFATSEKTVVTREYPDAWSPGKERYYPLNDKKNNALYEKYRLLSEEDPRVVFIGRLGLYKYYDMDDVIRRTLEIYRAI